MANTFKTITFAAEPASAGTPYSMYTAASNTTTVVLGLILTNIHTAAVTVDVQLVSDIQQIEMVTIMLLMEHHY